MLNLTVHWLYNGVKLDTTQQKPYLPFLSFLGLEKCATLLAVGTAHTATQSPWNTGIPWGSKYTLNLAVGFGKTSPVSREATVHSRHSRVR